MNQEKIKDNLIDLQLALQSLDDKREEVRMQIKGLLRKVLYVQKNIKENSSLLVIERD